MELFRESDKFYLLNREFKSGRIDSIKWLNEIYINLTYLKSEEEEGELKRVNITFILKELVRIYNSENMLPEDVAQQFQRIVYVISFSGQIARINEYPLLRADKKDDQGLFGPMIARIQQYSGKISHYVPLLKFLKPILQEGTFKKKIKQILDRSLFKDFLDLHNIDKSIQLYYINELLDMFKKDIEELDDLEVTKISECIYIAYAYDYVYENFKENIRSTLLKVNGLRENLILSMITCILTKDSSDDEVIQVTKRVLKTLEKEKPHSISFSSISVFLSKFEYSCSEIIVAFKNGLDRELTDDLREHYINCLGDWLRKLNISNMTLEDKSTINHIYYENFKHFSNKVRDTCIKNLVEIFEKVMNEKLKKEICEYFVRYLNDFFNTCSTGDSDEESISMFLNFMSFENFKNLILLPYTTDSKKAPENCKIVKMTIEKHYDEVSAENKQILSDLLISTYNESVFNFFDRQIFFEACNLLQDDVKLKIFNNADSYHLWDDKSVSSTAKANFILKLYETYPHIRPTVNEKFLVFFKEHPRKSEFVNVLEIDMLENELMPIIKRFSNDEFYKICYNCESLLLLYNRTSNESKEELRRRIIYHTKIHISGKDFFDIIELINNYNLNDQNLNEQCVSKFKELLRNDHDYDDSLLLEINKKFDIFKKIILKALEDDGTLPLRKMLFDLTIKNLMEFSSQEKVELKQSILKLRQKICTIINEQGLSHLKENNYGSSTVNYLDKILLKLRNPHNKAPGIAVIFHNDKWPDIPDLNRSGSEIDVELLKKTFELYSICTLVVQNPTVHQISQVIEKLLEMDFSNISCLIIGVMSHGDECDQVYARDGIYTVYDRIIFPLLTNESLESVPKFVFVQACKGSKTTKKYPTEGAEATHDHSSTEQHDKSPKMKKKKFVHPTQLIRFDSTFEGYRAIRVKLNGTPFIIALCEILTENGDKEELEDILKSTKKYVYEGFNSEKVGRMQCPTVTSTLAEDIIIGDYRIVDDLVIPSTEDVNTFFNYVKELLKSFKP